jgi:50S ribosomal protein L16 3-hydroxylase
MSRGSGAASLVVPEHGRDGNFALGPDFWVQFGQRYWGRRPVVLRQALARPLLTADEAFEGLVSAADRYRARRRAAPINFCIEHAVIQADVGPHLPAASDGSLTLYAERVSRQIGGRRFGVVAEDIQRDDARLWLRLREFVRHLYPVTGWPGEKAKSSVFLGNYRTTPFGVHRDPSAVFTFILHGRKRLVAWAPAFFDGKADMTNRLDYERYRREAVILEGEPGDIMYLPAGHWHTGEDAGGLAMTVTLTLFMEPRASSALVALTQQLLNGRVAGVNDVVAKTLRPGGRAPTRTGLARAARQAAHALRSACRDPELDRGLASYWLDYATAAGFIAVPDPSPPRPLPEGAVVRGDRDHPIMWLAMGRDRVICSANGHAFVLPQRARLAGVLRRINSGAPCRVRDLIARHARAAGASRAVAARRVRALLETLWSLRAIVVESG